MSRLAFQYALGQHMEVVSEDESADPARNGDALDAAVHGQRVAVGHAAHEVDDAHDAVVPGRLVEPDT